MDTPTDMVRVAAVGVEVSRLLEAIVNLGVADALCGGAMSAATLARRINARRGSLERFLNVLTTYGLVRRLPGGRFALTRRASCLATSAPDSIVPLIRFGAARFSTLAWGELEYTVRTGRPGLERALGRSLFEHLRRDPVEAAVFDAVMAQTAERRGELLARVFDREASHCVVDVGGGTGALLSRLLALRRRLTGIVFDMPTVRARAESCLRRADVHGRCRFVAGDFFRRTPSNGDVYVLHRILHDWDDATASRILRSCRRAMPPHAILFILEATYEPRANGRAARSDLAMMVLTGGRERTRREYGNLLRGAGLRLHRAVRTGADVDVLEARRA